MRLCKVSEEDREQVEEIAKGTWNGHDYLADVFDEWVRDGGFYCLKDDDGTIIALDKYTWHENGIIWLEGYRVRPEYRGMGYGWKMVEEMSRIIEKLDWRALRFMTSEANKASMHIGERMGFRIIARYHYLTMDVGYENKKYEGSGVHRLSSVEEAMDFMLSSEEYRANKGQYLAMWTAYDISEKLIRSEIEKGRGFYVKNNGNIGAIAFFYPFKPRNTLSIAFIGGREEGVRELLRYGIQAAVKGGYERYTLKTASERIKDVALSEGMKESDIGMALLYEKRRR